MTTMSELVATVSRHGSAFGVNRTGLAVGAVLGVMHLLWALLVAIRVVQVLTDFVFHLHFIDPVYVIEPFDPLRALGLVLLSLACGFFIGAGFALLWNRLHRSAG